MFTILGAINGAIAGFEISDPTFGESAILTLAVRAFLIPCGILLGSIAGFFLDMIVVLFIKAVI